jgi:hypothetical protein
MRGALWFAVALGSLSDPASWAQTRPVTPATPAAIARAMAGQLQGLAAAKNTLGPAQRKVDSHLGRVAWPDQAEAQVLAPPLVPPPVAPGHMAPRVREAAHDGARRA